MKIVYDPQEDVLSILLNDATIEKSHKGTTDTIFDYDEAGNLIKLKILNASKLVANPQTIEYSISSTQSAFKSSKENDSYLNIYLSNYP